MYSEYLDSRTTSICRGGSGGNLRSRAVVSAALKNRFVIIAGKVGVAVRKEDNVIRIRETTRLLQMGLRNFNCLLNIRLSRAAGVRSPSMDTRAAGSERLQLLGVDR